jgi:hypothetical protein
MGRTIENLPRTFRALPRPHRGAPASFARRSPTSPADRSREVSRRQAWRRCPAASSHLLRRCFGFHTALCRWVLLQRPRAREAEARRPRWRSLPVRGKNCRRAKVLFWDGTDLCLGASSRPPEETRKEAARGEPVKKNRCTSGRRASAPRSSKAASSLAARTSVRRRGSTLALKSARSWRSRARDPGVHAAAESAANYRELDALRVISSGWRGAFH